MSQVIHAVPNFSEGRRTEVIEAIINEVRNVEGVKLVAYFPDADFNRTVIEMIGYPEPLKKVLLNVASKAVELIDMRVQKGSHPRIGAMDTIPIFPLKNITGEECMAIAEEIGKEVHKKLNIPVYFTGLNARNENRKNLDYIRKGQYEELLKVANTPERAPDIGPAALDEKAGAVIVSAGTRPLVAFNVILGTDNLDIAKSIAKMLRGPSGGFTTVRSVGLKFEDRNVVVVSMNMFDYEQTPLYRTYELVKLEASRYSVDVIGTQLVGTLPQKAIVNSLEYYMKLENFDCNQIIDNHIMDL
jgi:glutamate formiminotransferase/formiminotetrahydrofolate cyclodeaminase